MWAPFRYAGAQRLWVAAGLSVALHAALVVSVQRQAGGVSPLPAEYAAAPLVARLTTAVGDAVLTTTAAEPAPITAPVVQAPPATSASPTPPRPDTAAGDGTLHYFRSSELERRPFPLTRIEIPPPESTEAQAGSVIIRLRISERGRVEDAKIVMGTGIGEFEAAALREFSRARFQPGYRNNLAVRSEMLIEVTLQPPAGGSKNSRDPDPAPRKD